jgi:uncharacterized protein
VNMIERVARMTDRAFDRARHTAAFRLDESAAVEEDLGSLRGRKYTLLVTFRRDGTPVPSPVWAAVDERGRAYVKTAADVGKVKRVRHDDRVLLAPSTARGRPTGPAIKATARILGPDEWPHAEQTLAAAYGIGRRASEALLGTSGAPAYFEIVPRGR